MSFDGGILLPDDSTIYLLEYLSIIVKFLDTWLKDLASDFEWSYFAYQDMMKALLKIQLQSLHRLLKTSKINANFFCRILELNGV